jgi:hypothetical protein
METKTIAPAALNALKEALVNIYWYKKDLRSFLMNSISDPNILARLDWDSFKRNIVTTFIDFLSMRQDIYRDDILRLMSETVRIEDFSHLSRLEDGEAKEKMARESVEALRKLVAQHFELFEEQKQSEEHRRAEYQKILRSQGVREQLAKINKDYLSLVGNTNHQQRGFALERLMKDLFALFDLDPKASFKLMGEQIDGAFTFDNIDYIFEGKWYQTPVAIQDLDSFNGKITRRLDNTLGLFLSINGFSQDAVTIHSTGRPLMILMDGTDLMAVLDGRISLIDLLLRKRRYASQTGNIYLKVSEILLG